MPNLGDPITSVEKARKYREQIESLIPNNDDWKAIMTCYLTDETSPKEIKEGFESGVWRAAKLYFRGHTTNSHNGVIDFENLYAVFETMSDLGMPLLVHGEIPDPNEDIFDLEKLCVESFYKVIRKRFPNIKIVAEHITTSELSKWVAETTNVWGTITPHHLMFNRNHLFEGGLQPDNYCLPILKRIDHTRTLRRYATSGNPSFGAGTDSAPHDSKNKYKACGCAGCFNIIPAVSMYAQVFDEERGLEGPSAQKAFGDFMSLNLLKEVYGMEPSKREMVIEVKPFEIPKIADSILVPTLTGSTLGWSYSHK